MDADWAAERLDQIRTLMERSASYRRTLAPTTLAIGTLGLLASLIGYYSNIHAPIAFTCYWLVVSFGALLTALLLIRRQALKSAESFWSLPTRRVAEAISPSFFLGLVISCVPLFLKPLPEAFVWGLPSIWMGLYGCGLYSAGFFMPRGIKLFGIGFLLTGALTLLGSIDRTNQGSHPSLQQAHLVMGGSFGIFHLAYGLYLYLTENKETTS